MGKGCCLDGCIKGHLPVACKGEADRNGSCQGGAPLAVIHFIFRRAAAVLGKGSQKPFFRISARVHEFLSDEAEFPFMGLASHPGLLASSGFFTRLAVVPAHIASVYTFYDIELLGIRPEYPVDCCQECLCVVRNRCFLSVFRIAHEGAQSEWTKSMLNSGHGEILQRIPQCIPARGAYDCAAKLLYLRHFFLLRCLKSASENLLSDEKAFPVLRPHFPLRKIKVPANDSHRNLSSIEKI